MLDRPQNLNLLNWRQSPYSRWSFHHVRELLPTENIRADKAAANDWQIALQSLDAIEFEGVGGETWSLQQLFQSTDTDALLVAHRGSLVYEWYAQADIAEKPHIVFSVSKSITSVLAGVMVGQGLLDPTLQVIDYLPQLRDSAYGDCSLQQVLDMTVNLDFDEDYNAKSGKFLEYRMSTGWHPAGIDQIDFGLHDFLMSLSPGPGSHGYRFDYKSPNSDLLGWVIETVAGERLANLFSEYIWQPMGAETDAYITLDRKGAARSAGGFCALPRDLLRVGEMMRNGGLVDDRQVIPEDWVQDCREGGDPELWARGDTAAEKFPRGSYSNKWYQTGNDHRAFCAIGIHSQWIYIDPMAEVVIVKLSSQADPLHNELGPANLRAFDAICDVF
jgi:CubicO group peptidase (beta-lactamase class C family)